ncbi:hypothetical protein BJY59DRAFT_184391 [Rhodotorula toruloides]
MPCSSQRVQQSRVSPLSDEVEGQVASSSRAGGGRRRQRRRGPVKHSLRSQDCLDGSGVFIEPARGRRGARDLSSCPPDALRRLLSFSESTECSVRRCSHPINPYNTAQPARASKSLPSPPPRPSALGDQLHQIANCVQVLTQLKAPASRPSPPSQPLRPRSQTSSTSARRFRFCESRRAWEGGRRAVWVNAGTSVSDWAPSLGREGAGGSSWERWRRKRAGVSEVEIVKLVLGTFDSNSLWSGCASLTNMPWRSRRERRR